MSGKPRTKSNNGWGGARPGTGPKPQSLSQKQIREIHRKIKKRAKEEGRSWLEILLDFVYGHEISGKGKLSLSLKAQERLSAMRLLAEIALVKQTEQNINVDKSEGPTIYLPEKKPDPAKLVPMSGGKAAGASG